MYIDITLPLTPKMVSDAQGNEKMALVGHLGTHFDVMDKVFPLDYTKRKGIVFDVSAIRGRDIECADIDMNRIEADSFVAFYTGYLDEVGYGTNAYFAAHPQLSDALIDALLDKKVSIIGIDCSGIRRGKEHTPKDQYCADRGVFVVENLCNLHAIAHCKDMVINTYPMNYTDMTGLPCRVIAEVDGEV